MSRIIQGVVLTLLAVPALADDPNYNYLQGDYVRAELDDAGFSVDGDGFGVGGSMEIAEQFHLLVRFRTFDFDFDVDLDQLAVGGGWHPALSDTTDLVFELTYISVEASALGFSIDDDGYGASLGLRSMLSPQFELAGSVNYSDYGDGDDTSVQVQAWYNFTKAFAIGGGADFGDDVTIYGIGARYYF